VGPGVLSTITSQGKKSCLLSPVLGAALVKNPLEDVANKNLLRPRFSYGQSTQTWLLGPRGKTRQIRVNNFYEKALPSRENLIPFPKLFMAERSGPLQRSAARL